MAECADAVHNGTSVTPTANFVKHSKAIDDHTIHCLGPRAIAIIGSRFKVPLARPDGIGDGVSGLRLTHTGIDDNTHIDLAVAVIVIAAPVDIVACNINRMAHHRRHARVSLALVTAIVRTLVRQVIDAIEVVLRSELAVALVNEILIHALSAVFVLGLELLHRVTHLLVGVLHQQDGHARATQCGKQGLTCLARTSRGLAGFRTRGHHLSLFHRSFLILDETQFGAVAVHDVVRHHARNARSGHVVEVALISHAHGQTILSDKEVEELVTHRLDTN